MSNRFFKARIALGLSPEFVARRLGMDIIKLVEIEQDLKNPTEKEISALCKIYGLPNHEISLETNPLIEELLGREDALTMAHFKEMMKGRI